MMRVIRALSRQAIVTLAVAVVTVPAAVRAEDTGEASRTAGFLRAHWDYPGKASFGIGVIATRMPRDFACTSACLFQGLTIQGAAGLGAGEIAIGYGRLVGETGRGRWLLRRTFIGYGLRAAALRTWGASTLEPHGATFFGVEGAMTVAQFGVRLGVFRQDEGSSEHGRWRIFGGVGWGF